MGQIRQASVGAILKRRARLGFVAYEDATWDLPEDRLNRVFAASGDADGRAATEFVY